MAESDVEPNDDQPLANHSPMNRRMIDQFLQNQLRELDLRSQELKIQERSAEQEHQFACQSLATQERVLIAEMKSSSQKHSRLFVLIGICVFVITALIGVALLLDKDAIVMEIVKALIYVGAGASGGYAAGHQGRSPPSKQQEPTEED